MDARERVLTALEGGKPDRVPRALSFYHVEIENLLPTQHRRNEVVDVQFVQFPPCQEEEGLLRAAEPFTPDTRLGNRAQVTGYARWQYRPQSPDTSNPLARAHTLAPIRQARPTGAD